MRKVSSSEQATARAIVERMREAAKVKTFGQLGKLLNGISSQAISKAITAGSIPQHWYDVIELKTGVCRNQICHGLQTVTAALDGRYDIKEEEMAAKKRHRGGSDLIMHGVDIRTVAEIMGHRNISQTMRYTHFLDAHRLAAIAAIDRLGR